jgi:glutathione S-transferase
MGIAESAMRAGRALLAATLLASPDALDENAPPFVPQWLRPPMRPVVVLAMHAFARKYQLQLDEPDSHTGAVRVALNALRDGLRAHSPNLLGSFSYADIVMATLIQGISPVADRFVKLGPATRVAWTRAALAADYADLIAWRDALYESHRGPSLAIPTPS